MLRTGCWLLALVVSLSSSHEARLIPGACVRINLGGEFLRQFKTDLYIYTNTYPYMNINLIHIKGQEIAEITGDGIVLRNTQDAVDIIGNCSYQGSHKIIIRAANINPDFFNLKTKVAGDILEKFSTYRAQLAIVGDFSGYDSKSLKDFIFESNKTGRINFVPTLDDAIEVLIK